MKIKILILLLSLLAFASYSQINNLELPTSINDSGLAPDASAILDVQSSDKGVLFPRMTLAERSNISSPGEGLLIFQTDDEAGFYYYSNGQWNLIITDKKVFDPSLPFGTEDLVGVHVAVTSGNPFIVPANSNFYGAVTLNDRAAFPAYFNSYGLNSYAFVRVYLGPNGVISCDATTNDKVIVHGYTAPDDVEVLFQPITAGQSYTVPVGKQLFLKEINMQPFSSSTRLYVDGVEFPWSGIDRELSPGAFYIFEGGSVITSNIGANQWVHLCGYFR